jgi:hypothetical protein
MSERQVRLAALVQQSPNPGNRVTLSEDRKEALDNPHPRIQCPVEVQPARHGAGAWPA